MRYLFVYFSSRIVKGVTTYIYTTRKALKCTLNVGETSDTFPLSYWDGKPKNSSTVTSNGSYTMWLTRWNGETNESDALLKEEAYLYREHYGEECVVRIDADGQGELIQISKFNELPKDEQNLVTAEQLNAS